MSNRRYLRTNYYFITEWIVLKLNLKKVNYS